VVCIPLPCSVREQQRAQEKQKRSLISADLRGDDYLPPEVLSQLPSKPLAPARAAQQQQQPHKEKAAATHSKAQKPRAAEDPLSFGMPRVLRKMCAACRPGERRLLSARA
jgi:hypothetical protein